MTHKQLDTAVVWWQLRVSVSNWLCHPHSYIYMTDFMTGLQLYDEHHSEGSIG